MDDTVAAAGADGETFHVAILRKLGRNPVGLNHGIYLEIPDGKAANLPGRRQIAFQQYWRNAQQIGDVIKAVTSIVWGQKRADIYFQTKQVMNGIAVFGPVQ